MKFYEYPVFNGSYYALIAANSKDESNAEYLEEVAEIDDDYPGPNEIAEEEARREYDDGAVEFGTDKLDFDAAIKISPALLLIDSDLV